MFKDIPIRRKLITAMLVICGTVMSITSICYYSYEYITVKLNSKKNLSILGKIISTNSTAALAFNDPDAAREILSSLKAQPHIVAACLYNVDGKIFVKYPDSAADALFPQRPGAMGYDFSTAHMIGFEPVTEGDKVLGTLYIKSDMKALQDRFLLFGIICLSLLALSLLITYILAGHFQRSISRPILALVETSKAVSDNNDYAVRAEKFGGDELGILTDAFNHMLSRIESQNTEITSFNQQLEDKVDLRTVELASANRELETFSYSVSHDLRAPLRKINMLLGMFKNQFKEPLDNESATLLRRVEANTDNMAQLIENLLTFSRIMKVQLEKKPLSMNLIVKKISEEIMSNTKDRRIEFAIGNLHDISADYATITQVWENLISNAIKYTIHQEIARIDISSAIAGKEVIYSIKDNGSGFDMALYEKLFTAFERLHSGKEFEGTGVGLAIVYRIIEKHGGRIWAESEEGKGATFYFALPDEG